MTSIPDGFKVFAECHTGTEIRWETATIRLSGKKLYFNSEVTDRVDHFRYPNFYQCIIVDDTSDGYLNLRTGPGSTYEVIAKLVKLDELQIDAEFNGWAHVIKVDRLPDLQGWVYRKHTFDDPSRPNCTCPEEGKDAGDPECTKFRDTIQEYAR
jgi:hypothetical protein